MVTHLRPYQRLALYHLRRSLEAGARRQYLDLPTGTGKSTLAAAFAVQRLEQTRGRVLGLVHRQNLALQLAETLKKEDLEVGLLMQGRRGLSCAWVPSSRRLRTHQQEAAGRPVCPLEVWRRPGGLQLHPAHGGLRLSRHRSPGYRAATLSPSLYMQMLGRGMRKAEGKTDCLVIDVLGNQPDPRRQVILPHVIGIEAAPEDERRVSNPVRSRRSDPVLRSILGGQGETGLALLDPLGRSHYRWTAYSQGYFARINAHVIAILERDPAKSGLYRSRQYAKQPERMPEQRWIERRYLPLRQQVALVHKAPISIKMRTGGRGKRREIG